MTTPADSTRVGTFTVTFDLHCIADPGAPLSAEADGSYLEVRAASLDAWNVPASHADALREDLRELDIAGALLGLLPGEPIAFEPPTASTPASLDGSKVVRP